MSWTAPPTGLVPLAAWHWRSSLLDCAAEFAQHSSSVADFVSWAIPRGARVLPVGIAAGFNINTPADLDEARVGVAGWFGARALGPRHSAQEDRCSAQPWPAQPV
jgi:hypothetical protein